ncbi:unnamed protein product [Ilex paraguariensis]|uniref:C2H2-type domain-containing protein n=1 Tax=Ilex paraguariensis TaxID=185542 RepID=A0ABC8RDS2_9AQUA
MTMKRLREDDHGEVETLAMANCLMLLSGLGKTVTPSGRLFECKTCKRPFSSFQALGGHRASHKRPKLMSVDLVHQSDHDHDHKPWKPKTHECYICGLEFTVGQALGGHMRRHRAVITEGSVRKQSAPPVPAILQRSNSKRVLCLDLKLGR